VAPRKDATAKKTIGQDREAGRERPEDGPGRQEPVPRHPGALARQRQLEREARLVELGSQKQKRYFFNVSMAKKFMQTFLVSDACKELIDSGKTTSIRDLYYVTKHTIGDTKQNTFEEQDESDPIIEDLEVTLDALREELHLFAARKGSMVGPITITDTGDTIDLRRMGSGGWAVPVDRRGERDRLPQARGEVRAADREGRGLDALQRGQVLEAQQLHHRARAEASRRAACGGSCSACTSELKLPSTCSSTTTPGASTSTAS
jgi:hypothetical protein